MRRAITLVIVGAFPLGAQQLRVDVSAAEVAISQGRLDDAERELYAASRRAPREPSARGALGTLLAARGHFRIGAVLLEEASIRLTKQCQVSDTSLSSQSAGSRSQSARFDFTRGAIVHATSC